MKITIPLMIQDPLTTDQKGLPATEGFRPENEEYFLNGPVSERVAVLDFFPERSKFILHGNEDWNDALIRPPKPGRKLGRYETKFGFDLLEAREEQLHTHAFMKVSVFATILKTLYLFEKNETFGRKITWAFDSPQLLVIPIAGEEANAFYHRDSNSLQFFYCPRSDYTGQPVYTCLSRDIIAHEVGHAIIDSIAPDLVDAWTPQSLAIHEALADITALLMAFDSKKLREIILDITNGKIGGYTAFSCIGEEIGRELGRTWHGIRNLNNRNNLNKEDKYCVRRDEPHILSTVLSGAIFDVITEFHERLKSKEPPYEKHASKSYTEESSAGYALHKVAERFKGILFSALDYLPPGEVSFVDYGRAIIAVDQIVYPFDDTVRKLIREKFRKRFLVRNKVALKVQPPFEHENLRTIDVSDLYKSDWLAYDFVNANLDLFCIPKRKDPIPFEVRPRTRIERRYADEELGAECIFKVAWYEEEDNPISSRYPLIREIKVGTTLSIDWDTGKVLSRLTSASPTESNMDALGLSAAQRRHAEKEYENQLKDRNTFIKRLDSEGLLRFEEQALGLDAQPLLSVISIKVRENKMRLRNTANLLHLADWGSTING